MSVWELVASLSKNGWQHAIREPPRRRRDEPLIYSPGADKIWYTRSAATSISSHYLRALLLADGSGIDVQHFQSSGLYRALLDGKPYTRPCNIKLRIEHFAEDDMDAGYEKPKRQRPKKALTIGRVFAPALMDGRVEEEESPKEVEEEDVREDEWSVVSEDEQEEKEEEEDEEGGADVEHEEENEAQDEEAENKPSPYIIPDVPDVGLNRLTPLRSKDGRFVGWEAGCNHPLHQFPNACRTNLRNEGKGRNEKTTRQMLCAWLDYGADLPDREAHFVDTWEKVEAAARNGTLPEEVPPVQEYGGVEDEDVHGTVGLRKRRRRK